MIYAKARYSICETSREYRSDTLGHWDIIKSVIGRDKKCCTFYQKKENDGKNEQDIFYNATHVILLSPIDFDTCRVDKSNDDYEAIAL